MGENNRGTIGQSEAPTGGLREYSNKQEGGFDQLFYFCIGASLMQILFLITYDVTVVQTAKY